MKVLFNLRLTAMTIEHQGLLDTTIFINQRADKHPFATTTAIDHCILFKSFDTCQVLVRL